MDVFLPSTPVRAGVQRTERRRNVFNLKHFESTAGILS